MSDNRSALMVELLEKLQADDSEMKAGQRNLRQDVQALHRFLAAMHGELSWQTPNPLLGDDALRFRSPQGALRSSALTRASAAAPCSTKMG